jgi:hypothetical protein
MTGLRIVWGLGAFLLGVALALLLRGADQRAPIVLIIIACLILFASAAIRPSALRKAKP